MDTQTQKRLISDVKNVFTPFEHQRKQHLGHDVFEGNRFGSFFYDTLGNRYIDCDSSSGIFNLGRRQPAVTDELKQALMETDQGNFPMISVEKATLAKKLAAFTPGNLECSVFSVTRGESIDFACKLARGATRRPELLYVEGSWFGQTGFALSLSDRTDKERFGPLIPQTAKLNPGTPEEAEQRITRKTAAVFVEPVQAENGCRVMDTDYLRQLSRICKQKGALLIVDETQTGFGRTGRRFAVEHAGILPDVLVIGEALGAGVFPIAATIFSRSLNRFMNAHPMIHLSTFGGSDLGCRAAIKALDEYDRLTPWVNAQITGKRLFEAFNRLMHNHSGLIRSVSGQGLLIAIEFTSESIAGRFCKAASENGLLVCPGEVKQESVIFRPSLLLTIEDTDDIIHRVAQTIQLF